MKWFDKLDIKLKAKVSKKYGKPLQGTENVFGLAVCAVHRVDDGFTHSETLANDFYLPFAGASLEWKEMIQLHHQGNIDGNSTDSLIIDIRIT